MGVLKGAHDQNIYPRWVWDHSAGRCQGYARGSVQCRNRVSGSDSRCWAHRDQPPLPRQLSLAEVGRG